MSQEHLNTFSITEELFFRPFHQVNIYLSQTEKMQLDCCKKCIFNLTTKNCATFFNVLSKPLGPLQVHHLLWIYLLLSCSLSFSTLLKDPNICLSFCFLLFSLSGLLELQNPLFDSFFSSYYLTLDLVLWSGFGKLCVSWNPKELYGSHFLGKILVSPHIISQ